MANPHKGELEFDVGNRPYKLSFSINALCELESLLGDGVTQIAMLMTDPSKLKLTTMRALFWSGLRDHHGDITIAQAGDLMDRIGLVKVSELVTKALTLSMPEGATADRPLAS